MKAMQRILGGGALVAALAIALSTPSLAQKLDNKNPPATTSAAALASDVDFGDDTGQWANDGECDDPRFSGTGSAVELEDADIRKDATDCRAAVAAGTVTFTETGTSPTAIAIASPIEAIDFGDDSSQWARDGECDDPRFSGTASADELVDTDMSKDATDCRAAYAAGTVTLADSEINTTVADVPAVDYGDDTSEWAKDGECDDPRFSGTAVADELLDADLGHDATDCRAAVGAGTATYNGGSTVTRVAAFDYGGDWSKWANDGECDDLRFEGEGADKKLLSEDMAGDATDCKALEFAGKVTIRTVYTPQHAAGAPYDSSAVDFGDNTSSYADDDQCDDPRFEGPGAAATLLDSDLSHDSADCKAAFEAGTIVMR